MMKIYRDGDKLVKDTGKAPPKFRGVLSIVFVGTSPKTVEESAYTFDELRALPEVNIATLSQEWKEAFGLLLAESKSATGSQSPQPLRRRAEVSEEIVPSSKSKSKSKSLEEYYAPLREVWSGWVFNFTPLVIIWLPYALLVTALYGFVAILDYLYDDVYALCACAITALALCAYMLVRLA